MHQHCTHHAILMPFQFPRIQKTINQIPRCGAGLHRSCLRQPVPAPQTGKVQNQSTQTHGLTSLALAGFISQPHSQWSCSPPQR